MKQTTHSTRSAVAALATVLAILGAACSSTTGDEAVVVDSATATEAAPVSEGAPAEEADTETAGDEAASTGNLDCDEFTGHAAVYRGASTWVPQIVDQETFDSLGGDLDAVDAAIEGLRPIQDIDGLFGPIRQGLDNLAADTQAVRDGRYSEKVGDYNVPGLNAVIVEEVCT